MAKLACFKIMKLSKFMGNGGKHITDSFMRSTVILCLALGCHSSDLLQSAKAEPDADRTIGDPVVRRQAQDKALSTILSKLPPDKAKAIVAQLQSSDKGT